MRALAVFLAMASMAMATSIRGVNWFGFNTPNGLGGDVAKAIDIQRSLGLNAVRLPFSFRELSCPGTRSAFLGTIDAYLDAGFTVMVDDHLREDKTVLEDPDEWVRQWVALAAELPPPVLLDLLNEPDEGGLRWETAGPLFLRVMAAVPRGRTFVIEGMGQGALLTNWGDGFCTDAELIAERGLSDPRPFFDTVESKGYDIILSPHVYPPSVTLTNVNASGDGLRWRLNRSFGDAPLKVLVGEFGSKFETAEDSTAMNDIARYIQDKGLGWFYWCWNHNSWDTGGLLLGDSLTLDQTKVEYLKGLM